MQADPRGTAALEVIDLSKTFVGQKALDSVSLRVDPGEVRALLGHNGSGKSTLIKILSGFYVPDGKGGTVRIGGRELNWGNPDDSHDAGLRVIHQDLGLVPTLTVLENLRLGERYATAPGGRIRWGQERKRAREAMARVGLEADPDARAAVLGPIERTQLAVARALQAEKGARVLVLDEPTAVLPNAQVERLHELVRRTSEHGVGVLYVTHRLEEVFELADVVTVLRAGRVTGRGRAREFDSDRLVRLIVGDRQGEARPRAIGRTGIGPDGRAALELRTVRGGELTRASFVATRGHVLGIAGLAGSGVHDVSRVLLGRTEIEDGQVMVAGEVIASPDARRLLKRGVAVLPSERALRSIARLSVRENYTLPDLKAFWRSGALRAAAERAATRAMMDWYSVTPREPERPLEQLSGGNQQKVTVAKWLRCEPSVLVLDEPTQGIDIGAKNDILGILRTAADRGMAVVYCSSDLFDLTLVCDRVLVMREGRIAAELSGGALTREAIIAESYRSEPADAS